MSITDSGVAGVDGNAHPDADLVQTPSEELSVSVCQPGTYLVRETDGSTVCANCAFGTYSDSVNAETCVPWSNCGWARILQAGTSSRDVECETGGRFRQFGSRGDDSVSGLVIGPDGDVYVAGVSDSSFVGFAQVDYRVRYVARFLPSGELHRVAYLDDPVGLAPWEPSDNIQLIAHGDGSVAVWADAAKPTYLVLTSLDRDLNVTAETRVPLEPPGSTDWSSVVLPDAVSALTSNELVFAGSQRSSEFAECGVGYLARIRLETGEVWSRNAAPDTCVAWSAVRVFGDVTYVAGNAYDGNGSSGFIVALTSAGDESWRTAFDASSGKLSDLLVTGDGGFIVAFTTGTDVTIERRTIDGRRLWSSTLKGAYFEARLMLGDAGDVWVTGGTDLVLTDAEYDGKAAHYGSLDAYVVRMSSDGETMWLRQFGSRWRDAGHRLGIGQGAIYVAGVTNGELGGSLGYTDGFLAQLSGFDDPNAGTMQGTRNAR